MGERVIGNIIAFPKGQSLSDGLRNEKFLVPSVVFNDHLYFYRLDKN